MEGVSLLAAQGVWAEVIIAVPLLKIPILGPFIAAIFFRVVSWLVGKSEKFANILIIGFQVQAQKKEYDKAVGDLQNALKNKSGDANAIQQASDDFDDALAGLVHNDVAGDTKP